MSNVARALVAIVALTAALPRGTARADDPGTLHVREFGVKDGWVVARLELVDAFDAEMRASLASGLPTTIRFTTELWRARSRWWDKQVQSRVTSYQIQWDPGERVYRLSYPGPPRHDTYEELDPLLAELAAQIVLLESRTKLESRHRYFITAEAAIRPLTLEEFRELDGWIGGRIRGRGDVEGGSTGGESGEDGGGGGFAQAVFGMLVDLAGFGDVFHRARTTPFRPAELRELSFSE